MGEGHSGDPLLRVLRCVLSGCRFGFCPATLTLLTMTEDTLSLGGQTDRLEMNGLITIERGLQDLLDVPTGLVAVLLEEEIEAVALQLASPLNHDVPLATVL
jgi:hypothetical protein